ncbi:serine/threonine-protein kinase [Thermobispora bispora]|uniref:non-specific serine/threonine protein kinase n=1 Tax=Thermobispora bispora (strain ATCC 19993 / DSM 43833 / CBS 139.67 / JCM 10125 / KCTC 9307 / NBRC 14880 / R51) TaxID=469371 RepID=D6Y6L2_THEBD|nr:serine/threonine-protein kinase [Thermobispora bispora]ADG87584.1 serine/threonine protein kinase [Thermobispora bispora DSM 43833]MDI9581748.1 protein kinase [Thermobispora sp.]QSI47507.1 serine/threonine protein kinase [Thermobispora bispora]
MNRAELHEGDVLTRRYVLKERIATGGMSVIWRAFDRALHRPVAVKVLDVSLDGDDPGRELIRREARATAQLIHPDAIEVYDYGETVTHGGRIAAYLVMRLVEGRSLADRIAEGPLPWREAVKIAAGLAEVLAAAHDRGIVHRDVTPDNVLLAEDGPKLHDFGIAAFVGEDDDQLVADFGTPPYVAPERLRGTTADPAVDVYSLGVLLYEMLTGALPYPETTWEAIEKARRDGPPPTPRVPGLPTAVADLCRECLAADPAARPSARTVATTLSSVLTAAERPPEPRARAAGWVAALGGAVALGSTMWLFPVVEAGGGTGTRPPVTPVLPAVSAPQGAGSAAGHAPPSPAPDGVTRSPEASAPPSAEEEGDAEWSALPQEREPRAEDAAQPARQLRKNGGRDPATPSFSLAATTEAPIIPPALDEAVDLFDRLVDAAEAAGRIDADVALDLRQLLHNAVRNGTGVRDVRDKLESRHREGRMPGPLKQELERVVRKVELALSRAG